MLTLKSLRYFVAAAEHRNFAKAAEEIHISKSSIILGVDSLEDHFGLSLFIRRPSRGLELTEEGRHMLDRVQHIFSELRDFEDDIFALKWEISGTLKVGVYHSFSIYFMPSIIHLLKETFPSLEVQVIEGNLSEVEEMLVAGKVDVILYGKLSNPTEDITLETVAHSTPHVIFAKTSPLAEKKSVSLAELANESLILSDMNPMGPNYILKYFENLGLEPKIGMRLPNCEAVRGYVGKGLGYAVSLIRPNLSGSYLGDKIVYRPFSDDLAKPAVVLGWLDPKLEGPSRNVEMFLHSCREFFKTSESREYLFSDGPDDLPVAV